MNAYRFNLDIRVHGMDLEDASRRFRDIVSLIAELVPGIDGTRIVTNEVYEDEVFWEIGDVA